MADDDEPFDIDTDSDIEDDDEESDDDTGFFPIDEPIVHSSQSSTTYNINNRITDIKTNERIHPNSQ